MIVLIILGVVNLSVTFVHIPGVIHYNSSRTLISWFDYYICAFPKCCESFAFLPREIVANGRRFTGNDVIFDCLDESVKSCVSSVSRSPSSLASEAFHLIRRICWFC